MSDPADEKKRANLRLAIAYMTARLHATHDPELADQVMAEAVADMETAVRLLAGMTSLCWFALKALVHRSDLSIAEWLQQFGREVAD
jgi:hypothetical protein